MDEPITAMRDAVDVVVVGAGPAGLSAALFLTRAQRQTLVFDGGPTRLSAVTHIHEFLGHEGMAPSELQARGRAEVIHYGGEIRAEAVSKIEPRHDGLFEVWSGERRVTARAVVLATGLVDALPPIPGLLESWGREVNVCPCFSGHEVRGQHLVAFGVAERLAQSGKFLSAWSPFVTVITKHAFDSTTTERLRAFGVTVVQDEVTALRRRDGRLAMSTERGQEILCDAGFISSAMRAASDLAATLCEVDADGFAHTDANGQTSRGGIWAIGYATDPIAHVAHAVAAGTQAGPWVNDYLIEMSIR